MKWVWQGQRLLQGPGGWSILSLWTWKNEVMFGAGLGWMNCFCPGRMDGWSPLDCCLHYNVVVGARIWSVSSIYPSIFGMDDPFLPTTHSLLLVLEVSVWPEVPYPRLTLSQLLLSHFSLSFAECSVPSRLHAVTTLLYGDSIVRAEVIHSCFDDIKSTWRVRIYSSLDSLHVSVQVCSQG